MHSTVCLSSCLYASFSGTCEPLCHYLNVDELVSLLLCTYMAQPCNPAVGGPAKSQLVHEVDALGGEIGRLADRCYLQKRVLNRSKVPPPAWSAWVDCWRMQCVATLMLCLSSRRKVHVWSWKTGDQSADGA